jgi:hypothetical protein
MVTLMLLMNKELQRITAEISKNFGERIFFARFIKKTARLVFGFLRRFYKRISQKESGIFTFAKAEWEDYLNQE